MENLGDLIRKREGERLVAEDIGKRNIVVFWIWETVLVVFWESFPFF